LWGELTVAASRAEHPAHDYFVDRYERVRAVFTERLAAGSFGGELRAGAEPAATAALFVAALDGLQTQWLLNRDLDIVAPVELLLKLSLVDPDPSA
jgi:hypothetical protein